MWKSTYITLPVPDEQAASPLVEVGLGEREGPCIDAGAPQHDDQTRIRRPWRLSPAWRMTATISSTVGGSAG